MGEVGLNRFCGNVSGFYCQLFVLVTVLLVGLGLGSCAAADSYILRSKVLAVLALILFGLFVEI
jgi:hypothetical protein